MRPDFAGRLPKRTGRTELNGGVLSDPLTQEQKLQIDNQVTEMYQAGADRKEIGPQANTMLTEFGLPIPAKGGGKCKLNRQQKEKVEPLMGPRCAGGRSRRSLSRFRPPWNRNRL